MGAVLHGVNSTGDFSVHKRCRIGIIVEINIKVIRINADFFYIVTDHLIADGKDRFLPCLQVECAVSIKGHRRIGSFIDAGNTCI